MSAPNVARPWRTPSAWPTSYPHALAPLSAGFTHIDERSATGGERLLSITKLKGVVPRDSITDAQPRAEDLTTYKLCRAGDLVVNQMSVYDGLLGVSPIDGLVSYHYLVFRPGPNVDARFIAYVLRTDLYKGDFSLRVRGLGDSSQSNVRTPHIRIADFLQTVVPMPPVGDQRRIADFLDGQVRQIDHVVRTRGRQIELLEERQQALLDSIIESEGVAAGWMPLRRVARGIEQGWSPTCDNVPAEPQEFGVLKLSAVRGGRFLASENKAMLPGVEPDWRYALKAGDLLVSRANTPDLVGDSAVVDAEYPNLFLCDLLYRVRLTIPESNFVSSALRTTRTRGILKILGRGTSLSMAKIRGEDVLSLAVPRSSQSDRIRVQSVLSVAARETTEGRSLLQASIAELAGLRSSLIAAAVSGEFDVNDASGRGVPA